MAQQATPIKGTLREKLGTHSARKLRREGYIPAIIYGHQQENLHIALPLNEFEHLLHQGAHLLEVDLNNGRKETVLLKEVQYNYLGTEPIHADLTRVDLTERVSVTVPLTFRGTAKGVKEGGILQQLLTEIEIECVVTEIPEEIKVNVSELEKGSVLHAKDIILPEGIKLVTDPETIVAMITEVAEEEEELPEAEAATEEPEVISKGKEKEETEERKEE